MGSNRPMPARGGTAGMAGRAADRYFELKSQIHRKLLGVLNMDRVSSLPKDRIRAEIGRVVERLLDEERVPMTTAEQTKIVEEVLDEVLGLGPLETLLKEPSISDILVNRFDKIYIERNGKLSETPVRFGYDAHLLHRHREDHFTPGRPLHQAKRSPMAGCAPAEMNALRVNAMMFRRSLIDGGYLMCPAASCGTISHRDEIVHIEDHSRPDYCAFWRPALA